MVENLAAITPADCRSNLQSSRRRLLLATGAILGSLAGCGSTRQPHATAANSGGQNAGQASALPEAVVPFSAHAPDGMLPPGWKQSKTWLSTKRTEYRAVTEQDKTVLHAVSNKSASGAYCDVKIAASKARRLSWSWKSDRLIPDADVGVGDRDDAVARILVSMADNGKKLSFRDMLFREQALLFTGIELPHSTLIYVWDPKHPVGTVLNIKETSRVRYLVIESGPARLGQWLNYDRDFYADFKLAFNETPGPVTSVGVTTDSNNTFSSAEAWYGDIALNQGAVTHNSAADWKPK